jgi:hypothetical protein
MENVGIFCGHLEYFTAIRYILWPFCNVVVIWYIFPRFGLVSRKICQPLDNGTAMYKDLGLAGFEPGTFCSFPQKRLANFGIYFGDRDYVMNFMSAIIRTKSFFAYLQAYTCKHALHALHGTWKGVKTLYFNT